MSLKVKTFKTFDLKVVPGFVHVRKSQIQGLFKAMYQQIQGLNTEEKGLEISKIWRWIVQNITLMIDFQTALSDMNMLAKSIQKMSILNVKHAISENIEKLKQETFGHFLTNSRILKAF